jgi:hypothetical protein
MAHQPNQQMQQCIRDCLDCYQTCLRDAMNHCLEAGGKHVEPTHFRLMINCAELCRTAADFMLTNSDLHARVCAVCAEVCDACAQNCEQVGDMDDCVQTCRRCAESCRSMSGAGSNSGSGMAGGERQTASSAVKSPM